MALQPKPEAWLLIRKEMRAGERPRENQKGGEPCVGSLTQSTSVFIRRSILVLLNFVLPLFCISLVSGPTKERGGLGKPNKETASGLLPQSLDDRISGCTGGLDLGLEVF